jgi:hypothetical protein
MKRKLVKQWGCSEVIQNAAHHSPALLASSRMIYFRRPTFYPGGGFLFLTKI